MSAGFIPYSALPSPIPVGLLDCLSQSSSFGVGRDPNGLNVTDADAVIAFIASYEGGVVQLAFLQGQILAALSKIFEAKFATGFRFTGSDVIKRTFQIDAASQQNIAAQATMAVVCASGFAAWPIDFYWIDAENGHMALNSPTEMIAFGAAAGSYVAKLILTNRTLKDAINAAIDMASLMAINIDFGWPVN